MRRVTDFRPLLVLASLLPVLAQAQVVEVPTFTVATPVFDYSILDADVAVGPDGNLGFVWVEIESLSNYESGKAFVRRVSPAGLPLGAALRADTTAWVNVDVSPTIVVDGSGGYLATWNILQRLAAGRYRIELYGLFASGSGVPLGSDFDVGPTPAAPEVGIAFGDGAVGLPSGAAVVWIEDARIVAQLYDTAREVRGMPRQIASLTTYTLPQYLDLGASADGGFVVAWSEGPARNWAVVLDADGQPRGPQFPLENSAGSWVRAVAASPHGDVVAMGTRGPSPGVTIWVRRFGADGTLLGEDVIDTSSADDVDGDLGFDEQGTLLAVWSERRFGLTSFTGRARAYQASGAAMGPPVTLASDAVIHRPRIAPHSGGRFVVGWNAVTALQATVLTVCPPGSAVCGDGVLVAQCEQCDDGPGNSDTLPDACRTDCRPARCGDGVLDAGERCDDGNRLNGDCCSWTCRVESDFDFDGICDEGDTCRLFPNPDQSGAEVCQPVALAGLTESQADRFADALADFAEIETPETGLGPVFNGPSCAHCHHQPTIGGSSPRFVTRIGRTGPGGVFDPLSEQGGSLVQSEGIATAECSVSGETVPDDATLVARRDTPSLFGLGLIDRIPDQRIARRADPNDRNGDGISGRVNVVGGRVGRFGWKAQRATLRDFAAAAYRDEMGITSPTFPDESLPQGGAVTCDPLPDPEDDGSGVSAFTDFMVLLAPPAVRPTTPETRLGRTVFKRIRCHACHSDRLRTDFDDVRLRSRRVRAFSDFLLHDMGPALADGIVDGDASGSEFRTAPLWGVRDSAPYLHDGRAATIEDAIAAHGGEGEGARDRFLTLTPVEKAALLAYVRSL